MECHSKTPVKKLDCTSGWKPSSKYNQSSKDTALKSSEVMELSRPPKTPSDDELGLLENDYDNDPLVSGLINPITMLIELSIPGKGRKMALTALLDSGCAQCLISRNLVEKLGPPLRNIKDPIAFCQHDGSTAGGIPASFVTKPLGLTIGSHSEILAFIVAPGMEWSLVLVLAWIKKWNPLN